MRDSFAKQSSPLYHTGNVDVGPHSWFGAVSSSITAAKQVEYVVSVFVAKISATKSKSCTLLELYETPVWPKSTGVGALQMFLEANRAFFDLKLEGNNVVVRLRSACGASVETAPTKQVEPPHGASPVNSFAPSQTGTVPSLPETAQRADKVVGDSLRDSFAKQSSPPNHTGNGDVGPHSCSGAVQTTASKQVDDVVKGFVKFINEQHGGSCPVDKLGQTPAWQKSKGVGKLKPFLEANRDTFAVNKGKVTVRSDLSDVVDDIVQFISASDSQSCTIEELTQKFGATPAWIARGIGNFTRFLANRDTFHLTNSVVTLRATTCAAKDEDMVAGFVAKISATKSKSCTLLELYETPVWPKSAGVDALQMFLEANRAFFDLTLEGNNVVVRLRSACGASVETAPTTQVESPHGASPVNSFAPSQTRTVHSLPETAQRADKVVGDSLRDSFAKQSSPPNHTGNGTAEGGAERNAETAQESVPRSQARGHIEGVRLSSLEALPRRGSTLWVHPAELRWTHDTLQRLFTCGTPLTRVATQLRQGDIQPSDLPMMSIVRHEEKWYSRNNRRLWCFKEAGVDTVEVLVSSVDAAFLRGSEECKPGVTKINATVVGCRAWEKQKPEKQTHTNKHLFWIVLHIKKNKSQKLWWHQPLLDTPFLGAVERSDDAERRLECGLLSAGTVQGVCPGVPQPQWSSQPLLCSVPECVCDRLG